MKTAFDVDTFATRNNTNKHALIVDGRYQLFDTADQCDAMLQRIIPNEDVEGSDFGSFQVLPPHFGKGSAITDAKETDLLAFAKNAEEASHLRVYGKVVPQWLRIK